MNTQSDIGKAAVKARRTEVTAQSKMVERRLVQACKATGISHENLSVEFCIGLLMLVKDMASGQRDDIAARGAAEVARLLEKASAPDAAAAAEAKDFEREDDLHVAFSGIPSDDLAAALTERAFVCYSDKRLSAEKPRTWQGRGRLAEIQALVGTAAAVFVRAERVPGHRAASAPPEALRSAAPQDGHGNGEPAIKPHLAAAPKNARESDRGDDDRLGPDAVGAPSGDVFLQAPEIRYSASSNVGAAATDAGV